MTDHTPGPWHRNIKPATKYPILFAGRNTHVLRIETSGLDPETVEANLCLAMAAPDLLEALEYLASREDCVAPLYEHERMKLRAAVAKAKGQ